MKTLLARMKDKKISYTSLASMLKLKGIPVDNSTVYRWYTAERYPQTERVRVALTEILGGVPSDYRRPGTDPTREVRHTLESMRYFLEQHMPEFKGVGMSSFRQAKSLLIQVNTALGLLANHTIELKGSDNE